MSGSGQLTTIEQDLVDAAISGNVLDVSARPDDHRRVRAKVIYDLCVTADNVHALGVQLVGATIEDALDFRSASLRVPLSLVRCTVGAPDGDVTSVVVRLDRANCTAVALSNCTVNGAVSATEFESTHTVGLAGTKIAGHLTLYGATIGGTLAMDGATISGVDTNGYSFNGENLSADNVLLRWGFSAVGAVWLYGAKIGGTLAMDGATISGSDTNGYSLNGENLTASGAILLRQGFSAVGAVGLYGARIGGTLAMNGATITGSDTNGYSLRGENLTASGAVLLREGFSTVGAVWLYGATIGGTLAMDGATVSGVDTNGYSFNGENLSAGGDVLLRQGFSTVGAVWLYGAKISGTLAMNGATINGSDTNGYSFNGENLSAGGAVLLRQGFSAVGAVGLYGARIAGTLAMNGATINGSGTDGYSLNGEYLSAGNALLRQGFTAAGTVGLWGADVAGRVEVTDATMSRLVLQDARCGEFADDSASWPKEGELVLAGFDFKRLDEPPGLDRREWVRRQGFENWSADPYGQVASFYERIGDESKARLMRIAMYWDDLRAMKHRPQVSRWQKLSGRWTRLWRVPFGVLLGFGYRRWPAGAILLALVVLAGVVFWRLDTAEVMVSTAPAALVPESDCGEDYQCFNAAVYGADVVLPIIDFGQDAAWRPDSTRGWQGTFGVWFRWSAIAIGWALASIFVAAFTRLVRRD